MELVYRKVGQFRSHGTPLAFPTEREEGQKDIVVGIQSPFEYFLLHSIVAETAVSFRHFVRGLTEGRMNGAAPWEPSSIMEELCAVRALHTSACGTGRPALEQSLGSRTWLFEVWECMSRFLLLDVPW